MKPNTFNNINHSAMIESISTFPLKDAAVLASLLVGMLVAELCFTVAFVLSFRVSFEEYVDDTIMPFLYFVYEALKYKRLKDKFISQS